MIELNQSAFPRSGTNTLNIGLQLCFPQYLINLSEYSPKAIKDKDNIFVVFRDPLDSISSWAHYSDYMQQTATLDALIDWWCVFAKTALEYSDRIFITTFNFMINNHDYVFNEYAQKFNLNKPKNVLKETIDLHVKTNFPNNFPRPEICIPESIRLEILESKSYQNADSLYKLIKKVVKNY